MNGIIAALIMVGFFSCMAPIRKELREKGVESITVMALTGFTAPLWIILALVLSYRYDYAWSMPYAMNVLAWVVLVIAGSIAALYLYRYQTLTSLNAFGLGFGTLFALLADLFIFKTAFPMLTTISIALFISAGLLISHQKKRSKNVRDWHVLGLVGFNALLGVVYFSLYKMGLIMQENLLLHVAICQGVLHGSLLLYGYPSIKKYVTKGIITMRHIVLISIFLIGGVFGEAYALKELPVSAVVLMALFPIILFAIYDSKKKELHWNPKTIAAVALIVIAILLLR